VRVGILLHVEINWMTGLFHSKWRFWPHRTSLMLPLFIEMTVPSQESVRSCICVVILLTVPSQESGIPNQKYYTVRTILNQIYYTVRTILKSNENIIETEENSIV
jgi:hypothetical protein